jgi:hypothetical protein
MQKVNMDDEQKKTHDAGGGAGGYHPKEPVTPGQACPICNETRLLRSCSSCHLESYCSRDCQRKHWVVHKALCRSSQVAHNSDIIMDSGATHIVMNSGVPVQDRDNCPVDVGTSYRAHSAMLDDVLVLHGADGDLQEAPGVVQHGCPWSTPAHPHECERCRESGAVSSRWETVCGGNECDLCMPCTDSDCAAELHQALAHRGLAAIGMIGHCIEVCPRNSD